MDNANNMIGQGAAIPLFDTNKADRVADEANFKFDDPIFTAQEVTNGLMKLLTDPSYRQNVMTMKIAAVAAGGAKKAEKTIRDYYINALTLKPGEPCVETLVDKDYFEKSRSAGVCKACCSCFMITVIFLFILIAGFPGVKNYQNFATHYQFKSKPFKCFDDYHERDTYAYN